jgi:hypothetical protein
MVCADEFFLRCVEALKDCPTTLTRQQFDDAISQGYHLPAPQAYSQGRYYWPQQVVQQTIERLRRSADPLSLILAPSMYRVHC